MEFEIVNVGQGNFNVLKLPHFNLFYDMGASITTREIEIKSNIIEKNEDLFDEDFGVVISHWDVDHYRLIISLHNLKKLNKMRFFVYPEVQPTATSQKALGIIEKINGCKLYAIPNIKNKIEASKLIRDTINRGDTPYTEYKNNFVLELLNAEPETLYVRNLSFLFSLFGISGSLYPEKICLFHSVNRADRNKNSLMLFINYSKNKYVFLTGDSHYRDINKYLLKLFPFSNEVIFMVPHHGGGAGKFNLCYLAFNKGEAIISVGKDKRYNHPLQINVDELEKKFGSINVKKTTALSGNISISLK